MLLCTLFIVLPCLFCCLSCIEWKRSHRQVLRDRGREPRASPSEREAPHHRRSSVGFNSVAHSSIRSETGSNPRVIYLDSFYTEFHPCAPPSPADFENAHEEQHLISFKINADLFGGISCCRRYRRSVFACIPRCVLASVASESGQTEIVSSMSEVIPWHFLLVNPFVHISVSLKR